MRDPVKKGLKRLLGLQVSLLVVLMVFSYTALGFKASYSALLGGVVFLVPSLIFALKLFGYRGAKEAKKIVRAFYVGESWKLLISMVLFTLVFMFVTIDALVFFGSFIVMQLTHWFAARLIKTR